jgi:Ca-activated chloride channel family protein
MKFRVVTYLLSTVFIAFAWHSASAQVNGLLKEGNRSYNNKKYTEAEKSYNEALDKAPDSYGANFNKGDALFKQGKYKEATGYFDRASGLEKDRAKAEQGYYNLGNSYLKQDDIEGSINAYKKALKINPDDLHAKYNLSYAIAKRNRQQRQQKQTAQNQPNSGNGNKNDQKSQPQPKLGQNQKPQYDNTPSHDQSGMSDAQAEQILSAINNNEEKIRQRLFDNRKNDQYKTDKPW